jgi:hypothetical protein
MIISKMEENINGAELLRVVRKFHYVNVMILQKTLPSLFIYLLFIYLGFPLVKKS